MRKQEIEQRIAELIDLCHNSAVKVTPQRLEIFRELALADDHPDAEKIFQRLRKNMPTLSLDTVYRTLWLLNDLGVINTLGASREKTRFDANLKPHHHFVCNHCGMTTDFYSDELSSIRVPAAVDKFGLIEQTHVEVRGICNSCRSDQQKSE